MWSSETLVKGVQAIQKQGHDMMTLAKDEEDEELVNEYNVPWFHLKILCKKCCSQEVPRL